MSRRGNPNHVPLKPWHVWWGTMAGNLNDFDTATEALEFHRTHGGTILRTVPNNKVQAVEQVLKSGTST